MITRFTSTTVFLNSRLVHFPRGTSAHEVFARLAKHTEHVATAQPAKAEKRKAKPRREKPAPLPFAALAATIVHRLENPKLRASQREAAPVFGKGSNGKKKVVRAYIPANGAKSVSFGGHVDRALSETDRAEVIGAVTLALCAAPTDPRTFSHALGVAYRGELPPENPAPLAPSADLVKHGECFPCRALLGLVPLSFAVWKQAFSAARSTLGMKRKTSRENLSLSLEGLETAMHEGQGADLVASESLKRAQEAEREAARAETAETRAKVARETRRLHALIQAAFRADIANGERKARSSFRTAIAHLKRAIRATLGEGHAHEKTRQAAYERDRVFRAYVAKGEAQAAKDRQAEQAARDAAEIVFFMHGVSA